MIEINSLSAYLKEVFDGKIAKICIDGGFSCPNRENGGKGCLFCTDSGSGEFTQNRNDTIRKQIENGKKELVGKWKSKGYIAYFQNFTNTYESPDYLNEVYSQAIASEGIVGLAVATRPDCMEPEIIEILDNYNKRTFLWIELGLQTSNENTASLINRGYKNEIFEKAVFELKSRGIKFVVHLIAGLPGENKEMFLESVKYVNSFSPWGIKFHSIYIQNNSPLWEYSIINNFEPLEMYEYIDWVTDAVLILNKNIIIHRLTGDPDKKRLIKPNWQKNKLKVISEIKRVLKEKANQIN